MKTTSNKFENLVDGVAQVLNIYPANNKVKLIKLASPSSDLHNLVSDWNNVGNDIKSAMRQFSHESKTTK